MDNSSWPAGLRGNLDSSPLLKTPHSEETAARGGRTRSIRNASRSNLPGVGGQGEGEAKTCFLEKM